MAALEQWTLVSRLLPHCSNVLSAAVVKLVEVMFRTWYGFGVSVLCRASPTAASSPVCWSSWTLARRLPDHMIQSQAGSGNGGAAARLRFVVEIEVVWYSEDLL